ncbi:MAG: cyclase family protein [Gemmatimonadaceae bacterium]
MTWIDISVPLAAHAPAWPGDTPYEARWTWSQEAGSSVNVSAITLSPHVGTHADAPYHVRRDWASSERLATDAFIGECTLVDVSQHRGELQLAALGEIAEGGGGNVPERLLLRTGCSVAGGVFPEAWPWLAADAVRLLVARGLRLLGVDAPSVDARDSTMLDVHNALFAAGAFNLENLDLRQVAQGDYDLFAVPLAIVGLDAAPVRALLRRRA